MPFSDEYHKPRIELDTKNCRLSEGDIQKLEELLDPLREPVHDFPVCDLYVTIGYHERSLDYHVRTSLVLPKRTLFTGERDESSPLTAFGRCVRKLVKKLTAYKDELSGKPAVAKTAEGTAQEVVPAQEPDASQLTAAVEANDYPAFRQATFVYEEAVRKRAGRWIERYPDFVAQLGEKFDLSDLVEEVFLNAFERFDERPQDLRLGKWLEELIDPSVKALLKNPDLEQENIEAVRSWQETARENEE